MMQGSAKVFFFSKSDSAQVDIGPLHSPVLSMGRKHKQPDTAIAHVTRLHTAQPPHDRTVSVHTTSTGRLGQSTTYVLSNLPSTAGAVSGVGEAGPGGEQLSPDFAASGDPTGIEDTDESPSLDDKEPEDSPLLDWARNYRGTYLDEMIRHDGRAGLVDCSTGCGGEGMYKCKDCFGFRLWCRECFVEMHMHLPFHRVLVSH